MLADLIMNASLLVLAISGLTMIVYRLLFHGSYRLADSAQLQTLLDHLRNHQPIGFPEGLGWLDRPILSCQGNRPALRRDVERFGYKAERWHDEQLLVANTAMGIGFLFTVVSLVSGSSGNMDLARIIGLGMMSTVYGLIISLPTSFMHGVFHKRVGLFLLQVDAVLDVIDHGQDLSGEVPTKPAGPRPSSLTGRRMPEHKSIPDAQLDTADSAPASEWATAPAWSTANARQLDQTGRAAQLRPAHRAAADVLFDELVLDQLNQYPAENHNHETS